MKTMKATALPRIIVALLAVLMNRTILMIFSLGRKRQNVAPLRHYQEPLEES